MAMTTRCPHCGTAFKVVADQLRVRNGLVRCGVCSRVFDGYSAAVDGPAAGARAPTRSDAHPQAGEPPAAATPSPQHPVKAGVESPAAAQVPPTYTSAAPRVSQTPPTPAAPHGGQARHESQASSLSRSARLPSTPDVSSPYVPRPYVPPPYVPPASPQRDAAPPASPEPAVLRGRDDSRRAPSGHDEPVFPSDPLLPARDSDDDGDAFGYREPYAPYRQDDVDDAEQQARDMASPGDHRVGIYVHRDVADVDDEPAYVSIPGEARTRYDDMTDAGMAPPIFMDEEVQRRRNVFARLWATGCLLALILLGLQCVYIYRTPIATAVPPLRPALEAVCAELGCQVGYARRLERISIIASSLQPQGGAVGAAADDGRMRLVLAVTMRNRYDKPQPWPALVLQLTDLSDTVVVRKVLLPQNYLPPGTRGPFPAGGELSLSVPLQVDGLHVNGYQLDKFFP